jgi:hypothetical protein
MLTKRDLLRSAALAAITASTAKSVSVRAQTSADRPGFFKAKDIAEAGFVYGLPIVMNYGVMYEYAIDRNSGQFKAPFNQIKNEPNVFTYKDTAIPTPNSDTPYSLGLLPFRPIIRIGCRPTPAECGLDRPAARARQIAGVRMTRLHGSAVLGSVRIPGAR